MAQPSLAAHDAPPETNIVVSNDQVLPLVSVGTRLDLPTIQDAIAAASNGDTLTLSNGVYTGTGNHDIDLLGKALLIRSESDDPTLCIIDCEGTAVDPRRGFYLGSGETLDTRISGITITNAYAPSGGGGAIYAENSSFTMTNCVVTGNFMPDGSSGAGILVVNGSPVISDCRITNNVVDGPTGSGAGIAGSGGTPTIQRCLIASNDSGPGAGDGGGVAWHLGAPTLEDCVITRNAASMGAGLSVVAATIQGCTIVDNYATDAASGILGSNLNIAFSILGDSSSEFGGTSFITCSVVDTTGFVGSVTFPGYNSFGDPGFCDRANHDLTLRGDSVCLPANNPCNHLIGALGMGCGPTAVAALFSTQPRLLSASPNPFNPTTTIQFRLPRPMHARLYVCDVSGRLITTLVDRWMPQGLGSVSWTGIDEQGIRVGSGVYFYCLSAGGATESNRMVLLK